MTVARSTPRTRIQSTFKIDPTIKRDVDLLAYAFGKEKSQIIEEAVRQYAARHEDQLRTSLQGEIARLKDRPDEEVFGTKPRRGRSAGGAVTGKERSATA
ncbi:MAG TPA: hypothetical protein VGR43_06715 [Dehalococcoidia bacterium]|nr:hypothetical protein [Dehalococcoidia bacterium]